MNTLNKITLLSVVALVAACAQQGAQQPPADERADQVGQVGQGDEQAGQQDQQVGQAGEQGQAGQQDQQAWAFDAWDANSSRAIEPEEFNQQLGSRYDTWAGDDAKLTEQELASGMFQDLDQDGDTKLSKDELSQDLVRAVGGEQYGEYRAWDLDNSGDVEQADFTRVWSQSGTFGRWDQNSDGSLDRNELGQGFFEALDQDRSGAIEQGEWAWKRGGV